VEVKGILAASSLDLYAQGFGSRDLFGGQASRLECYPKNESGRLAAPVAQEIAHIRGEHRVFGDGEDPECPGE
jgi:hypothetical protein